MGMPAGGGFSGSFIIKCRDSTNIPFSLMNGHEDDTCIRMCCCFIHRVFIETINHKIWD